uniref:Atlastin 2 n=1 Tax=Rhipicephalus zambeziensis TaxID=60191 RepID=A0A224YK08_9ACAR
MGKQVEIVSIGQDHTVQLNREELERILLAPNVKDKPVAVVSIMGTFRQGKSFLMNFLLRYLRSHDKSNWMGEKKTPLTGFSWSTRSERETKGINVWDEVFLVPTCTGDELAVLLMDTQGAFDKESSSDETANIFALSILTSSLQIYNILHNLQMDHLQHLQLVAEYGKFAQKSTTGSQFQKLVFLIRDWQFSDLPHGAMGGHQCLQKFMSTKPNQHQENKELLQSVFSCFSSTDCFLMPQLGTPPEGFDGSLSQLGDTFKQKLGELVPWLVASENLEAKKIAGTKITCEQLMNYFTVYVDVFKDGRRPRVATLLQATAEESHRNAKEEAKALYEEGMREATYQNVQELEEMHDILLKRAKDKFRAARKMGNQDFERRYLGILEKEITGIFDGLSFKQKLLDFKKAEEKMKEEYQRCMDYLQERQEALDRASDKMERIAQYTRLQAQTNAMVSTLSDAMTPLIAAATLLFPPAGIIFGTAVNHLLRNLSGAMSRISDTAFEDGFPGAGGLKPEMSLRPVLESVIPMLGPDVLNSVRAGAAQGAGMHPTAGNNWFAAETRGLPYGGQDTHNQ